MQTQTYNALLADFDSLRANASANQNRRTRSAHQGAMSAARMSTVLRFGVVASIVVVVLAVVVTR